MCSISRFFGHAGRVEQIHTCSSDKAALCNRASASVRNWSISVVSHSRRIDLACDGGSAERLGTLAQSRMQRSSLLLSHKVLDLFSSSGLPLLLHSISFDSAQQPDSSNIQSIITISCGCSQPSGRDHTDADKARLYTWTSNEKIIWLLECAATKHSDLLDKILIASSRSAHTRFIESSRSREATSLTPSGRVHTETDQVRTRQRNRGTYWSHVDINFRLIYQTSGRVLLSR